MALFILKILGRVIAVLPEAGLRGLAVVLGEACLLFPPRRRLLLSNLHHAFPDRPAAWHRAIARESCRRLIETALLSLATPYLSTARCGKIVAASPALLAALEQHRRSPAPTIMCSPHLAGWEAQTAMPLAVPGPFPEFGIIFRPLDNPAADAFVQRSRERFGLKLLSRKAGFADALKILRRRGIVGVLFDQNAGMQGALTTLFGRVCSTSELPGLMAEKFKARVYGIFPRRVGFWRIEIGLQPVASDGTTAGITLALNRWLESMLAANDNLCASWLWIHDRWRHQDLPAKRLRLESKRDLLGPREAAALPRRTRVWIRLPNWLGDVVMALPLIRALRGSRPDAEITLIARPQFLPLLKAWGVGDRHLALPPRGPGHFAYFWRARHDYPDVFLLLTNSQRGDLEAWLTRCPQRFGLVLSGRFRPLLSHRYRPPAGFDEGRHHQIEVWENFLRHFGLNAPPDCTPFATSDPLPATRSVALICGSENAPEKRWPIAHWRALIDALPGRHFVLFGTAGDKPITRAVASGFPPGRVTDLAGRTDLPAFARHLHACALLVTNDTGGMHLANAVGVPLVALFGPTNPARTGPVFSAPARLLQPPGCPPTGGGALSALVPAVVAEAVRELLAPLSSRD